ncbi:MAG: dTDP-4-amino-4,6-dideoxygalactose transaminase [Phycisphaerales bacterium]|nr:dTDP-4-amino-4,6-dideoxygalactose transaminase [Phycisphaerales bacterium]
MRVPFNRSDPMGRELEYMQEALAHGQISGGQIFTRRCEHLLQEITGVPRAILTTSCTHALEMAAILLNITTGDEVIVPSFAFVSTINAFVLRGATPVFVDIREDTLNLDESLLDSAITSRTRAVVPVHYAGVACEMNSIMAVAVRRGVAVVEDNAHGLMGSYQGRKLGTFGCLATQSFHETKNFTCGEGGALMINASEYTERAEIIRDKGTNRSRFIRGQVDKYTWIDLGSSYVPSDMLAAFLLAQLEQRHMIQSRREKLWTRYQESLASWARSQAVRLPVVPAGCDSAYHLYHLVLPSPERRDALMDHLAARGILSVFHYLPLHQSPMARAMGAGSARCPVAESIAGRLLRLPLYNSMGPQDQDMVIAAILDFQ